MSTPFDTDPLYQEVRDVALDLHALHLEPELQAGLRHDSARLYLNTVLALRASDPSVAFDRADDAVGAASRLAAALDLTQVQGVPHDQLHPRLATIYHRLLRRFRR